MGVRVQHKLGNRQKIIFSGSLQQKNLGLECKTSGKGRREFKTFG